MALLQFRHHLLRFSLPPPLPSSSCSTTLCPPAGLRSRTLTQRRHRAGAQRPLSGGPDRRRSSRLPAVSASALDLNEENVRRVLADARTEFAQIFDASVGITGEVDLADLDGPFVKLRLKGRFWHKRSTVLARLDNYLRNRIPEILEVDIEDEKQLDDSPENF